MSREDLIKLAKYWADIAVKSAAKNQPTRMMTAIENHWNIIQQLGGK